ncbi:selenide, water dikinase [Halalkalibacillus sediminis]|uniref:Septation ring formation regulator EzrA n=1 Tax=Halalkalibacillus sediminis TaxID=2018042 RepID=A0A2I0QY83_9BACI|nr:septation ring formation regulator EzrA [Halalkalibacillus sediminis]PKR79294.1 selenide, water dikinase [Halalkalibacillus sediminis]
MEYILGIFIVIVLFILTGVFMRKRVYQRVDELEEKKVLLMNRRVADELGKVRGLNLTGETEELFETWRSEWDDINQKVFANVEEELLDAEESAEKYRFGRASRTLKHVDEKLNEVEHTIDEIYQEVDRLLHSEQDSREEAKKLDPRIREVRKKVLQNGYQLGKAEVVFEVELDEIEQEMSRYEEVAASGNYTDAYELVNSLKARLDELERKVDVFPHLYRLCKHSMPEDLDHLQNGVRDMREEGYRVQHLGIEKEIHTHHETLHLLIDQLDKGFDDGVEEKIEQMKARIVEIYDQLENEALDKKFVVQRLEKVDEQMEEARETFSETKDNIIAVKENYHLTDDRYDQQYQLEKTIEKLNKEAMRIREMVENGDQPFSEIRIDLEQWLIDFEAWREPQEKLDYYLHNLRKDELDARERIDNLKQKIANVRQQLQKSNLPGIPSYILDLVEQARSLIGQTYDSLEDQPLDMEQVEMNLTKAEKCVNHAVEQTKFLIEQAYLAERVIQYANRYRSKYPVLAANISEAETHFRNYEYETALEKAGNTLEEIEPGALERIEKVTETSVS